MDFSKSRKISTQNYYFLESAIFTIEVVNQGDEAEVMTLGDISDIEDEDYLLLTSEKTWEKVSKILNPFKAYNFYQTLKKYFGHQSLEQKDSGESIEYLYVLVTEGMYLKIEYVSENPQQLVLEGVGPKNKVGEIVNQFEKWLGQESSKLVVEPNSRIQFFNPFKLYFDQGRELIAREQHKQDVQRKSLNAYLEGRADDLANEQMPKLENVFLPSGLFLFVAAFEGFLNLIYELYLYPELRDEDRISGQLKRSQIDIKLRLAPRYCSCFKERVIVPRGPFKELQKVINLRNDFVHSNLTSSMVNEMIVEDNVTFRNPTKKVSSKYWPNTPQEFQLKHLEKACEIVEQMIEFVLDSMKVRHKREISRVLELETFLTNFIDGEYVIEIE